MEYLVQSLYLAPSDPSYQKQMVHNDKDRTYTMELELIKKQLLCSSVTHYYLDCRDHIDRKLQIHKVILNSMAKMLYKESRQRTTATNKPLYSNNA